MYDATTGIAEVIGLIHSHDPLEVTQVKVKGKEEDYIKSLCESVEKDLRDREPLEEKAKIAILQYHSALMQDKKGGQPEDSQLDTSATRQYVEMAISRFMNPIFQRETVYLGRPLEPQFTEIAGAFEDLTEWAVGRAPFRLFVEQWLKQAFIFTKGTAKIPFRIQTKTVKNYYHETGSEEEGNLERHWGLRENDPIKIDEMTIEDNSDANPEVVPWVDFITPVPCSDIQSASRVTHRIWKSSDALKRDISRGMYREKDPETGKTIIEMIGSPTGKPDAELNLSLNESSDGDSGTNDSDGDLYEIFEIYTSYAEKEVIVTIERKSKTCLRFIENFYMEDERPFVTWSYEKILNDIDGTSLCYLLEPNHRALSAILNQRLDAASRSMSQIVAFSSTLGMDKYVDENRLPSDWYSVNSTDLSNQIMEVSTPKPFDQLASLESEIRAEMMALASLNEYNKGVEQIQRPTATGQIALIEEGKQPQYARMESFREALAEVGMMMIARYRQFHPVNIKYFIESKRPETQGLIEQVLTWPKEYWREQVIIEPTVTSQTMNKDLRKQELLALVDKVPQIGEQIMGIASSVVEAGPMSAIAKKFLDFEINSVLKPFMKEFEIDADEFLDFGEEIDIGQQFSQAIQQAQGQIEQLQSEVGDRDAKLEEANRIYHDLMSKFVSATNGKVPTPPPIGKSKAVGPLTTPPGMGGGSPIPGQPSIPPVE